MNKSPVIFQSQLVEKLFPKTDWHDTHIFLQKHLESSKGYSKNQTYGIFKLNSQSTFGILYMYNVQENLAY